MQQDIRARVLHLYDKVLENDLSLTVDYADDKEAFAAEKKKILIRLTILQMLNLPLMAARRFPEEPEICYPAF